MSTGVVVAFVGVAVLAYITPGPDWFVVMRHTTSGRRSGFVSALGVQTGLAVHMSAAALGVTAVLLASATTFNIIKFAGTGYLVFLGVQSLLRARRLSNNTVKDSPEEPSSDISNAEVYGKSLFANVLNPKAALFFAAVLPQFIVPAEPVVPQVLVLGVLDIALGIIWWSLFIYGIVRIKRLLGHARSRLIIDRLSGAALIVLGGTLAFTEPPRQ